MGRGGGVVFGLYDEHAAVAGEFVDGVFDDEHFCVFVHDRVHVQEKSVCEHGDKLGFFDGDAGGGRKFSMGAIKMNMMATEKKMIIDVRRASDIDRADAALLATLGRETFRDAFVENPSMPLKDLSDYLDENFTPEAMAAELADPKAVFLIAEIAGEAAGYAKLIFDTGDAQVIAERPVKLKRLYVHQKFLGAGVGPLLMGRCIAEATARNADAMWLTVWEHNPRAQAFYLKWGFENIGTIDFTVGESVMNDALMALRVNSDE